MKTSAQLDLLEIKRRARPILLRYGVKRAGVFGSAARREMRPASDIDILVEIEQPISLFKLVRLKLELEEALGHRVDLGEYAALKPRIRERVLQEEVPIL
ncbi:MAG: nucleotidyltransferase family protein [Chloroflexi bacterium]|nr:nucleotidyltransferase family protein [Chloroflexota bacterium]